MGFPFPSCLPQQYKILRSHSQETDDHEPPLILYLYLYIYIYMHNHINFSFSIYTILDIFYCHFWSRLYFYFVIFVPSTKHALVFGLEVINEKSIRPRQVISDRTVKSWWEGRMGRQVEKKEEKKTHLLRYASSISEHKFSKPKLEDDLT